MLPIRKYIESGKMSLIYRFLLLIWDAVCINLCSYAALFIRYELKWDKFIKSGMSIDYPHGYITTLQEMMIVNTLLTLIVFTLFRLYNSLWRYASLSEVIQYCIGLRNFDGHSFFDGVWNLPQTATIVFFYLFYALIFYDFDGAFFVSYHPIPLQ